MMAAPFPLRWLVQIICGSDQTVSGADHRIAHQLEKIIMALDKLNDDISGLKAKTETLIAELGKAKERDKIQADALTNVTASLAALQQSVAALPVDTAPLEASIAGISAMVDQAIADVGALDVPVAAPVSTDTPATTSPGATTGTDTSAAPSTNDAAVPASGEAPATPDAPASADAPASPDATT